MEVVVNYRIEKLESDDTALHYSVATRMVRIDASNRFLASGVFLIHLQGIECQSRTKNNELQTLFCVERIF
jgi:hypothetical protein